MSVEHCVSPAKNTTLWFVVAVVVVVTVAVAVDAAAAAATAAAAAAAAVAFVVGVVVLASCNKPGKHVSGALSSAESLAVQPTW